MFYIHLHVTLSVKTPPNKGPATLAIPYIAPIKPEYIGRLESGTEYATMIKAPEKMPADPIPAIALPRMSATEFGAAPQIKDPSSKIPIAVR